MWRRVEGAGWLAQTLCLIGIALTKNQLFSTAVGWSIQSFCSVTGSSMTSHSCYRVKRLLGDQIYALKAGLQATSVSSCCPIGRMINTATLRS
jgi:hypothetical protein